MTSSSELRPATALLRAGHVVARRAAFPTLHLVPTPDESGAGSAEAADVSGADAWEAGREAGYRAGLLAAEQEQARWLAEARDRDDVARREREQRWAALLGSLGTAVHDAVDSATVRDLHATAAELGVEIAEALVGHHLEVAGCAARDAVGRALADVPRGAEVTVRVHPDDADLTPEEVSALAPGCAVELVLDPSVERSGAVVTVGDRTVDAQVGAALARVREVLAR
jgi:flagellar assembly protein FliH